VVTPAFADYLVKHWNVAPEKISVIENGVETDFFSPQLHDGPRNDVLTDVLANDVPGDVPRSDGLRRELGGEGKFVVSYIGTIGMAQGLEMIVDAAARLQSTNPEIVFWIVGEGAQKDHIAALLQSRGLSNLRTIAQQPRQQIPAYIAASDVCLVLLKKTELFKTVIPTKMLEFMSCARPVILGVEGQARKILQEADCGLAIEPESSDALADAILRLAASPELAQKLGKNGREYVVRKLSRRQTAEDYTQMLEELLNLPRRGRSAAAA
jgi:glycosyltransferase involved in cell wall biosynthesis